MSTPKRISIPDLRARKGGTPIVALTAYTAPIARLADPQCDMLLVGDSLGMVIYGMDSTLPVTLDMMILHGQAVMRASTHAAVVIDLPFGSYQESTAQAFATAARALAETGAAAVKLEGGTEMAETIHFLSQRGVPVMAHIGLTPQSVNTLGGYATRGRGAEEGQRILADARAVAEAGAFCVVIEGTVESVARAATQAIAVPTIGIGASASCDGQILVIDDMLGITARVPRFVRKYAELGGEIAKAIETYADDVRNRRFPDKAHITLVS